MRGMSMGGTHRSIWHQSCQTFRRKLKFRINFADKRTMSETVGRENGLCTIKEVSRQTGVPSHTLRFWESRFGEILQPPRTSGGQRRYDEKSIETVRLIRSLVYEQGMTLAGARREMEQRQGVKDAIQQKEMEIILSEITELVRERLISAIDEPKG